KSRLASPTTTACSSDSSSPTWSCARSLLFGSSAEDGCLFERHLHSFLDDAAGEYLGVECHGPFEFVHDGAQHTRTLLARVRVISCHHASAAQLSRPDADIADIKNASRPLPFVEVRYAADDQIRAESPSVNPHVCDRAICRDQQRKNIESFRSLM